MSSSTDIAEVEAIVRAAGTSFYRGMAILPPPRRQAMYAIYAFCRIVDDIADEESPFASRKPRLDEWRARIAALYAGQADDAVTRELRRAITAYVLRREDFIAVIDGMEMDAEAPVVAPDEATLDLYCDRVAAAVGRLSVRAFGSPTTSGAPCNSPTSCATSTRIPAAAASICRAICSTPPASRMIPARYYATRPCRRSVLPSPPAPTAISATPPHGWKNATAAP